MAAPALAPVSTLGPPDPNAATLTSPGYQQRLPQWQKVRDAIEGEEKVKERTAEYLPKPEAQDGRKYAAYLARASFYSVTERTLAGLLGMIFRVDPRFELPGNLEPLIELATTDGFSLEQACRTAMQEVLSLGRFGIMADLPGGVRSGAPDPYLATYPAESIISWQEEFIERRRVLTRVVLREFDAESSLRSTILRELVMDGGVFRVRRYEEREQTQGTAPPQSQQARNDLSLHIPGAFDFVEETTPHANGRTLDQIPFVFVNPFDTLPRTSKPPFLDLVNMNFGHYRNSADYEHSLFLTGQPTPWVSGVNKEDTPKTIGSGAIWTLPGENAKAGYLEFTGPGIAAIREAMTDKEGRMAALGASLLRDFQRSNVTAETTRLDSRAETSVLLSVVKSVELAFTKLLRMLALWTGQSEDAVVVTLNRDFVETRLDPLAINALVAGWQAGAYSRQTLHENLQRGEIIPPDRDLEEEDRLIEERPPLAMTEPDLEEDPAGAAA